MVILPTVHLLHNFSLNLQVFSYILRTLEGVAEAASWSAVFAMLLHMFPDNVATIYAVTEASFSFAEMIGPTFGAVLYESGGFVLPFLNGAILYGCFASCLGHCFRLSLASPIEV